MIINSELPLPMLDQNLDLNEYDFVLFHLYKKYPEYRDYFKSLRQQHPERIMIFDNSAYEFFVKKEELNLCEFAEAIKDLQPDFYILPDVLMDMNSTLIKSIGFLLDHGKYLEDVNSTPMAVVQGNTSPEFENCIKEYKSHNINQIAIPFHNSFFKGYATNRFLHLFNLCGESINDDVKYAAGRVNWIWDHKKELRGLNYVHLLGSHCPREKSLYNHLGCDFIRSMDTGYPVKCGIAGHALGSEPQKPDIIIDDFMEEEIPDTTKNLIKHNILKFRRY